MMFEFLLMQYCATTLYIQKAGGKVNANRLLPVKLFLYPPFSVLDVLLPSSFTAYIHTGQNQFIADPRNIDPGAHVLKITCMDTDAYAVTSTVDFFLDIPPPTRRHILRLLVIIMV